MDIHVLLDAIALLILPPFSGGVKSILKNSYPGIVFITFIILQHVVLVALHIDTKPE